MRINRRNYMNTSLAIAMAALCACGAQPGSSTDYDEAPAAPAAPADKSKVLAEITLAPEHTVIFEEIRPGLISILEQGRQDDQNHRVTGELVGKGLDALWADLAKEAAMPSALVTAIHRDATPPVASLKAKKPKHPDPAGPEYGQSTSPIYTTASEQSWFHDRFCTRSYRQQCIQGWNWAHSGNTDDDSGRFVAVAMVGSEGTAAATFTTDYWSCSATCIFDWCWDWDCNWARSSTDSLRPGYWMTRTLTAGDDFEFMNGTTFRANLDGAGSSTQVSLSTQWEPWAHSPPPPPGPACPANPGGLPNTYKYCIYYPSGSGAANYTYNQQACTQLLADNAVAAWLPAGWYAAHGACP